MWQGWNWTSGIYFFCSLSVRKWCFCSFVVRGGGGGGWRWQEFSCNFMGDEEKIDSAAQHCILSVNEWVCGCVCVRERERERAQEWVVRVELVSEKERERVRECAFAWEGEIRSAWHWNYDGILKHTHPYSLSLKTLSLTHAALLSHWFSPLFNGRRRVHSLSYSLSLSFAFLNEQPFRLKHT